MLVGVQWNNTVWCVKRMYQLRILIQWVSFIIEMKEMCIVGVHYIITLLKNNFIFNQYFRKNGKIDLEHISQKEMYIRIVEKKVFNFSIVDKNILLIDKKKYFHKNNGTMTKKNTCVICDLKWRIVCTVITHMYIQSWIGLKWKMFYQFETS